MKHVPQPWRGSPAALVPLVLSICPIKSMLDLGCGFGVWSRYFYDHGVTDIVACDALDRKEHKVFSDDIEFQKTDLTRPVRFGKTFDLVTCLEVAEHLPESAADTIVETATYHSNLVFWSAAVPGQGGDGHVNEQWLEYWADKFGRQGFVLVDPFRRRIWNDSRVYWWYRQNCVIFTTPDGVNASKVLKEAYDEESTMLSVVHPEMYTAHRR